MAFEGKISVELISGKPYFILDAEPHVMQRIRKIFDNCKTHFEPGDFTHKPILFPITISSCKDLEWICTRYNLEKHEDVDLLIHNKSIEYDNIIKAVSTSDNDPVLKQSQDALIFGEPLREHQIKFYNMFAKVKRILLADKIGTGKTASALSSLSEPESRPAIAIVPSHLCTQWEREAKRFLPKIKTHVIRGYKTYKLPNVDLIITSYNRLYPWQDILLESKAKFSTIIFDEVHELRHQGTAKREISRALSLKANYVVGLSGTPIYNMGSEIWSVIDAIRPNALGPKEAFEEEWCVDGKVLEPSTLNSYLKKQGLMLRRTDKEVGVKIDEPNKSIITIDADLEKLKQIQDIAKVLALSVLSGNVGEEAESARQFDWKLRHATGVSKARPVAEFTKMLLEEEEKVVISCWHREVYDILMSELRSYNPVMYSGTETSKQKDEAVNAFINGNARVFIISLRSGAGLDGLQRVCRSVVFAELDWSPHVMDQVVGRLARDGQKKPVNAFYLTVADGSDPFLISVIGEKRSQHDGIIEGKSGEEIELLQGSGPTQGRIKEMAQAYLKSIGEEAPEVVIETGLIADITAILRRLKTSGNAESEMQDTVNLALKEFLKPDTLVEKEKQITKRSRLDFLVSNDKERIAIECKITSNKKQDVYRQVRRYIEEANINGLILFAPWFGIQSFKIDGVPVIVIDSSISKI